MRGPLGNHFPLDLMRGKDIVVIGGGFAFTTLRSLIIYLLEGGERDAVRQDHRHLWRAHARAC